MNQSPKNAAELEKAVPEAEATIKETTSELGVIKIHDNVLAALIIHAALGVDGVLRLAGSALVDGLVGIVGSHSRAIEINKNEDGKLTIAVKLVLRFGVSIPEVALAVQRAVIEQVEQSAGITVVGVNVIVQQLEDPDAPAAEGGLELGAMPPIG